MARILVADDNRQFVRMLCVTLEDDGHEVACAYSGLGAADLIEREDFDLVILDMLMPGLSGDAVAERLRDAKPGVAVLLTTGVSGSQFAPAGYRLLRKPFTEQELLETVRGLL